MGKQAHSRMFQTAETSPVDMTDIAELIAETLQVSDYLQDLTPRGMAALMSVEI